MARTHQTTNRSCGPKKHARIYTKDGKRLPIPHFSHDKKERQRIMNSMKKPRISLRAHNNEEETHDHSRNLQTTMMEAGRKSGAVGGLSSTSIQTELHFDSSLNDNVPSSIIFVFMKLVPGLSCQSIQKLLSTLR